MGKSRRTLSCSACGHPVSQWVGRCPGCGEFGTIGEAVPSQAAGLEPLLEGPEAQEERFSSGLPALDRVLGGGMVRGSVTLLTGEPGVGKSTLLLQLVGQLAAEGKRCVVASGEESRAQVASRARRLRVTGDLGFASGRELPDVLAAGASDPDLLVVDSIQAIRDPELSSLPGGPSQVRACTDALVGLAKARGVTVILAGQVTKDGEMAGPRTLEHAVDAVCTFEAEPSAGLRVLVGGKNRFGPEGEVAWLEMTAGGLKEVGAPGVQLSGEEPGAAVALVRAGRRALPVEVQALWSSSDGPPRRQVSGLDPRRFGLMAAVLGRVLGARATRGELYGAAAGGLYVDDPAADLAVAAAIASAVSGRPPPEGSAFCGEVGLTGVVRPAPSTALRLAAAPTAGVRTVFCAGEADPPAGVRIIAVRRVEDAVGWALRVRSVPDAGEVRNALVE